MPTLKASRNSYLTAVQALQSIPPEAGTVALTYSIARNVRLAGPLFQDLQAKQTALASKEFDVYEAKAKDVDADAKAALDLEYKVVLDDREAQIEDLNKWLAAEVDVEYLPIPLSVIPADLDRRTVVLMSDLIVA